MKTRNEQIISRALDRGSAATTVRGAARWLLRHPAPKAPTPRYSAEQFRLHAALDSGKPGDSITIPKKPAGLTRIHGYRCFAFEDETTARVSREQVERDNPRKKNISTGTAQVSGSPLSCDVEPIYYKGSFRGYTGSTLISRYQSAICLSRSGRSAVWVLGNKFKKRFIAPAGMIFMNDSNGVLLHRESDGMDYHPTPEEWRARNFATLTRARMAANWSKRQAANKLQKEQDRFAKIFNREIKSTRVTLEDSRRAGNCVEGSLRFAERKLGVDRETILGSGYLFSVSATRALAHANGDLPRVQAAVRSAFARETTVSI